MLALTARLRPSWTLIVWPLTVAAAALPSTITFLSRIPPSFAAIVFSSTRSIAAPDVLRIVAVESTTMTRLPHAIRRSAS